MKTLYIDASMGAAGDMLTAALLQLFREDEAIEALNKIDIPGVKYTFEKVSRCGVVANHVHVYIEGEEEDNVHNHKREHHHHTSLDEVHDIISSLLISDKVKADAIGVYDIIADAESKAHGMSVSQVHFHEVGMMDAIADVVAVCQLIDNLAVDRIIVSPVNVGYGQVHCAHGVMPVPAPATANIIEGIPVYAGDIEGEMCTPTGAALLKYFADYYGKMPVMTVENTGYGAGKKDFPQAPNVIRTFLGVSEEGINRETEIIELCANVDDMTAEEISFAVEKLMSLGARDVSVSSVLMKKGRLGTLFRVITTENMSDGMTKAMFKYTSTIGIRKTICSRQILDRQEVSYTTSLGVVKGKKSTGFGVEKIKLG
ncbi:MAG: nickel pincer cofactor biosynthesis protein LarC, partial [Pseudobutyrivibrio sp.]|nr:nickel pincer cofactor biosynthesis protein LarC [Pseudobutyrivibrio sp.]